jgi:hypothetical protein
MVIMYRSAYGTKWQWYEMVMVRKCFPLWYEMTVILWFKPARQHGRKNKRRYINIYIKNAKRNDNPSEPMIIYLVYYLQKKYRTCMRSKYR